MKLNQIFQWLLRIFIVLIFRCKAEVLSCTNCSGLTTITADPMRITVTKIEIETTNTMITKTIQIIITQTQQTTKIVTSTYTSTALSITMSTQTTKKTASITLSTTLTKINFQTVTTTVYAHVITTATTLTSFSSVLIVSQLVSTSTSFVTTSFSTSGTLTIESFVTKKETVLVNVLDSISTTVDSTGTLTVYTDTSTTFTTFTTTVAEVTNVQIEFQPYSFTTSYMFTTTTTIFEGYLNPIFSFTWSQSSIKTFETIYIVTTNGVGIAGPLYTVTTLVGYNPP